MPVRFDGLYFSPDYNYRYGSVFRFFPNGWCLCDNYELTTPIESVGVRLKDSLTGLGRYHIEGSRIWITLHMRGVRLREGRVVYQGEIQGDTLFTKSENWMSFQREPIPLKYKETFKFYPRELPEEPELEKEMTHWLGPRVPWRVHEADGAELVRVGEAFWMYRAPVRVRQYQGVARTHNRGLPDSPSGGWLNDMPVVKITWEEASDYASWVGGRLPTVEEWRLAWGDPGPTSGSINGKGVQPVWLDPGDVSPWGVTELAGNVSEWSSTPGLVLGGSYRSKTLEDCRKTTKTKAASAPWIGFRCVIDI